MRPLTSVERNKLPIQPKYKLKGKAGLYLAPLRHWLKMIHEVYRQVPSDASDEEVERIAIHNACLEELVNGLDKYVAKLRSQKRLYLEEDPVPKRGRPKKQTEDQRPVKKRVPHRGFVASHYWDKEGER